MLTIDEIRDTKHVHRTLKCYPILPHLNIYILSNTAVSSVTRTPIQHSRLSTYKLFTSHNTYPQTKSSHLPPPSHLPHQNLNDLEHLLRHLSPLFPPPLRTQPPKPIRMPPQPLPPQPLIPIQPARTKDSLDVVLARAQAERVALLEEARGQGAGGRWWREVREGG